MAKKAKTSASTADMAPWPPPKKKPRRWRTYPTSILLPQDLRDAAQRVAARDRRSVSNLILVALEEYLVRRRAYPEEPL
jgi:hypothetical protein